MIPPKWKAYLLTYGLLPLACAIAWSVNAEGIRLLCPMTAKRLIRGVRFDSAHIVSLLIMFVVFLAAVEAIKIIRHGAEEDAFGINFDRTFSLLAAGSLLCADSILFYLGLTHQRLFGATFQFLPFLLACIYWVATSFLASLHVKLWERYT